MTKHPARLFKADDATFVKVQKDNHGHENLYLLKRSTSANGTPFISEKLLSPRSPEFSIYSRAVRAAA